MRRVAHFRNKKATRTPSPRTFSLLAFAFSLHGVCAAAQDGRAQYPSFLSNSYVDLNIGYVDYPFSSLQVEPGYRAESIAIPHLAVRLLLIGHRFNDHLSAQISYMRPVLWVRYRNINGVPSNHSVWMNVAGLTLRSTLPLTRAIAIHAEYGLGLVTRSGFEMDGVPVVKDANYSGLLLGAGLEYHLSRTWDLGANTTFSPANPKLKQPHTLMFSGGFAYNLRPLPAERVKENATGGFAFPRNLIQVGYTTNRFGVGVNDLVANGAVPIFWGGSVGVERGLSLHYERNLFHSRRLFSFDCGASVSSWKSALNKKVFYTTSLFPLFRFSPLRLRAADIYFTFSVAGPTSVSRVFIDGHDTGKHFTFQDLLGLGLYAGSRRNINLEARIGHYSNGNLFPRNAGIQIPLTFSLGYAF